ncbi:MAG: DUF4199 domain-containing protein [Bacteroidales bacterium]|nr:DUF4199 domain-containing protein [Bacteroidales bacterium]
MEENKPSNVKVAINHGLLLGVALILFSLLLYVIGIPMDSKFQWLGYLVMVVGVVLGIKQWRDKYNDGFLTYGQAFSNGFLTILFAGILTSIWSLLFFSVIAPGEIDKMIEIAEEKMYESQPNLTDEQIEMALSYSKMFMSPVWLAVWGFIGNLVGGAIISAVVAIFMKKEKPIFEE